MCFTKQNHRFLVENIGCFFCIFGNSAKGRGPVISVRPYICIYIYIYIYIPKSVVIQYCTWFSIEFDRVQFRGVGPLSQFLSGLDEFRGCTDEEAGAGAGRAGGGAGGFISFVVIAIVHNFHWFCIKSESKMNQS